MAYVRGNSADYESWAQLVNDTKWGWKSIERMWAELAVHNKILKE